VDVHLGTTATQSAAAQLAKLAMELSPDVLPAPNSAALITTVFQTAGLAALMALLAQLEITAVLAVLLLERLLVVLSVPPLLEVLSELLLLLAVVVAVSSVLVLVSLTAWDHHHLPPSRPVLLQAQKPPHPHPPSLLLLLHLSAEESAPEVVLSSCLHKVSRQLVLLLQASELLSLLSRLFMRKIPRSTCSSLQFNV